MIAAQIAQAALDANRADGMHSIWPRAGGGGRDADAPMRPSPSPSCCRLGLVGRIEVWSSAVMTCPMHPSASPTSRTTFPPAADGPVGGALSAAVDDTRPVGPPAPGARQVRFALAGPLVGRSVADPRAARSSQRRYVGSGGRVGGFVREDPHRDRVPAGVSEQAVPDLGPPRSRPDAGSQSIAAYTRRLSRRRYPGRLPTLGRLSWKLGVTLQRRFQTLTTLQRATPQTAKLPTPSAENWTWAGAKPR